MPKGYKFSQAEAVEKIKATWGYLLRGAYVRKDQNVLAYCPIHDHEQSALPANLFRGMRLGCCGKEKMRERVRVQMTGSGNVFFGRRHSVSSKERMSRTKLANPNSKVKTSRQLAYYERLRKESALRGVPRSAAVKQKLSEHFKQRYKIFDYCVRAAERNRTAGKPGLFYIAKIGDILKFGSTTRTMHYRLVRLRQKHSAPVTIELCCVVPDAGAYEADMMRAHRQHWRHGEYFTDFRLDTTLGESRA